MRATYVAHDGEQETLEILEGTSLMRAAVSSGLDGIIGECGGRGMCATCHVYVAPEFLGRLPAIGDDEELMLELTASERKPNSRLSCQIVATRAIDGIVVRLPEDQL